MGQDERVRLTTMRNSPSLKTNSRASHNFTQSPNHPSPSFFFKPCGDGGVAKRQVWICWQS